MNAHRLNPQQVEDIINKVAPLIAGNPEDESFFRGVLHCYADSCNNSGQFTSFIANVLKTAAGES